MQKPKSKEEATGRIKILKIPDGEAPQWVREAWVGLILACCPTLGFLHGTTRGALSGKEVSTRKTGVIAPQNQALAVLEQHDAEAAGWWKARDFPQPGQYFFFDETDIGIVSGVTEAPMRVFDDMETGRWEEMPLGTGGR
ncbi:MAG: hypothetical protein WC790_03365 [Candidatus Paceibacterota bacterium]|jgi:hypothetical protein